MYIHILSLGSVKRLDVTLSELFYSPKGVTFHYLC